MTRERALELASGLDASFGGEWTRQDVAEVADVILSAVAEAYETCAKIIEDHDDGGQHGIPRAAAEEIRALAPKPQH